MKLLRLRQVADALTVSPRTISRLVRQGRFPPPLRIGRALRWPDPQIVLHDMMRVLEQTPAGCMADGRNGN